MHAYLSMHTCVYVYIYYIDIYVTYVHIYNTGAQLTGKYQILFFDYKFVTMQYNNFVFVYDK